MCHILTLSIPRSLQFDIAFPRTLTPEQKQQLRPLLS